MNALKRAFCPILILAVLLSGCKPRNRPPDVQTPPIGPGSGLPESTYSFTTWALDPDGDSVGLQIAWGDSTSSLWTDYVPGGETISWRRTWPQPGRFAIRTRARDPRAALSDWSPEHILRIVNLDSLRRLPPTVPVGPSTTFEGLIEHFSCVPQGPAGESAYIEVDWGDGDTEDYFLYDPVANQETLHLQHGFRIAGDCFVRARVQDWDSVAEWSGCLRVTVKPWPGDNWRRSYRSSAILSAARAPDGGFVFTGDSSYDGAGRLFFARADPSGNLIWMRISSPDDVGLSVWPTADNGCIVAGGVGGPWGRCDITLLRSDPSGDVLWRRFYDDPNWEECGAVARCVRPTLDGAYVVAHEWVFMKTDSSGDSEWTRPYGGNAVSPLPDGGYLVAGRGTDCARVVRLDSWGALVWEQRIGTVDAEACGIGLTGDGGCIVGGFTYTDSAFLARLDASGSVAWFRSFAGVYETYGHDVAVTNDGGCYLTGETYGGIYLAHADASGNLLWQRVVADGAGYSVIPAPDGGCFIGGTDYEHAILLKVAPLNLSGGQSVGSRPPTGLPRRQTAESPLPRSLLRPRQHSGQHRPQHSPQHSGKH